MIQPINLTNQNNTGRKNPTYQNPRGDFSAPVTMLPEGERNYCLFNQNKVNFIISQKEHALLYLKQVLQASTDEKNEKEIVETLYIIDRMCDNGTKGIPAMYPVLAKFNDTKSANIQAFLSGIYRKTQVPDAFGPLVKMLIQNSTRNLKNNYSSAPLEGEDRGVSIFDPNEEIGGAILEYIKNYSNNPKAIDYSA